MLCRSPTIGSTSSIAPNNDREPERAIPADRERFRRARRLPISKKKSSSRPTIPRAAEIKIPVSIIITKSTSG